jgi:hypothetical protein
MAMGMRVAVNEGGNGNCGKSNGDGNKGGEGDGEGGGEIGGKGSGSGVVVVSKGSG